MNQTTSKPEHEIRRPGWKSSEFVTTAATLFISTLPIVLPLLDDSVKRAPEGSTWGLVGACIVAAGYALSRGLVKASRNTASAAVEKTSLLLGSESPKSAAEPNLIDRDINGNLWPDDEPENQNIEVIPDADNQA
jgi:hypothetical protein